MRVPRTLFKNDQRSASGFGSRARAWTFVVPPVRIDHRIAHRDFAGELVKFRPCFRAITICLPCRTG